jgi:hypothetical protein
MVDTLENEVNNSDAKPVDVNAVAVTAEYLKPKDLYDGFVNDSYKTTCCHDNSPTCDSCYSNCDIDPDG